jgi:hypothetical protein
MSKYWVNQVPELQPLTEAEQHDIIAAAKRGKFSLNELLVVAVWFQVVFMLAQRMYGPQLLSEGISFTSLVEMLVMSPFMALIFFPIYRKKIKRHIFIELARRNSAVR